MTKPVTYTGYMCKIAFDYELGGTDVDIYHSLEGLRRGHPMADECGIVEVEVTLKRVISEGTWQEDE